MSIKKTTLTLFTLLAIATESMAQVAINEENFPDANFRNFLLKEPFGSDGVLTSDEIANQFYIVVYDEGITNLKGIEHFTALLGIDCSHNQLTALDVSKNTQLKELYCEGNQIRGAQMDALIASLPNKKGKALEFGVRDEGMPIADDNDITMAQVAAAKAKGWIPQAWDVEEEWYYNYAGSDATSMGIVINSANFPDFYFRRFLFYEDFGEDGVLTPEEIANTTELFIVVEFISDLTGIEHFTALKSLNVSQNGIKTLDLSKNTALEEVDCSDNSMEELILPVIGNLTHLNCSENKLTTVTVPAQLKLESLTCSDNEALTSLDLSTCTSLKHLSCSNTNITSIDLSACKALERLGCSNTKLTTLSLENNTALTDLYCNDIGLTSLDLSKSAALKDLRCSGNKLTTLDLSPCVALRRLECENNQLTTLDLTNNKQLYIIYCGLNQIKGEQMDALLASLRDAGDIYVMYLDNPEEGNDITKEQIAFAEDKEWTVYAYTEANGWMEYQGETGLPIDQEHFPDRYFRNILKSWYFGIDGFLTDTEIAELTSFGVHYNSNIQSLKGIEYFTELETLECYYLDQLTSLDLSANTKLKELDCSTDGLTSLIVSNAATNFTLISCYNNQIKGAQMTAFVESLPTVENGELQVINFYYAGEEGNDIDTNQVAIANAKGWAVLAATSTGWEEYPGSETTAITSVTSAEPQKADNYYTTDGRRIKGKPTQRGLYINNGKKVIIR